MSLGVSRECVDQWRGMHSDFPRRADKRHFVPDWREWMAKHGLGRSAESGGADAATKQDLEKKLLREKIAMAEFETGKMRGELLVASELIVKLGAVMMAIQNRISAFPYHIAPLVAGFTDVPEVIAITKEEINTILSDIHECAFLSADVSPAARAELESIGRRALNIAPPAISEMPDDEDAERPAAPKKGRRT